MGFIDDNSEPELICYGKSSLIITFSSIFLQVCLLQKLRPEFPLRGEHNIIRVEILLSAIFVILEQLERRSELTDFLLPLVENVEGDDDERGFSSSMGEQKGNYHHCLAKAHLIC